MSSRGGGAKTQQQHNAVAIENVGRGTHAGYIVDDDYLVDLAGLSRSEARDALKLRIETIIAELETYLSRHAVHFTVGKTGVGARKGFALQRMNTATWLYAPTHTASIGARWKNTYLKKGYRAIVPIACVTPECIPAHLEYPRPDAQRYALDLEEDLYVLFADDPDWRGRFVQGDQHYSGKKSKKDSVSSSTQSALLLYVALKLEEESDRDKLPLDYIEE